MARKRSLFPLLFASTALLCGMLVGPVSAATSSQTPREAIHCGLWSGSHGDISGTCRPRPVPKPGGNSGHYVALGDSVAAGLGLPADQMSGVCGRSPQGYPKLVAEAIKKPLINASCSGATVGDLVTRQAVEGPNIPAQLDTAFAHGTPAVITITAGANDAHWAEFIRACYASDCTRTSYDLAARGYVALMKTKLDYALSEIYARSHGQPPKVVLTGYYNPFSAACATQQQDITRAELVWLGKQSNALNRAIRHTGRSHTFVRYAPLSFRGHDICAAQPWVQGPQDPAPFHPTAQGQQAIARAVTAVIR